MADGLVAGMHEEHCEVAGGGMVVANLIQSSVRSPQAAGAPACSSAPTGLSQHGFAAALQNAGGQVPPSGKSAQNAGGQAAAAGNSVARAAPAIIKGPVTQPAGASRSKDSSPLLAMLAVAPVPCESVALPVMAVPETPLAATLGADGQSRAVATETQSLSPGANQVPESSLKAEAAELHPGPTEASSFVATVMVSQAAPDDFVMGIGGKAPADALTEGTRVQARNGSLLGDSKLVPSTAVPATWENVGAAQFSALPQVALSQPSSENAAVAELSNTDSTEGASVGSMCAAAAQPEFAVDHSPLLPESTRPSAESSTASGQGPSRDDLYRAATDISSAAKIDSREPGSASLPQPTAARAGATRNQQLAENSALRSVRPADGSPTLSSGLLFAPGAVKAATFHPHAQDPAATASDSTNHSTKAGTPLSLNPERQPDPANGEPSNSSGNPAPEPTPQPAPSQKAQGNSPDSISAPGLISLLSGPADLGAGNQPNVAGGKNSSSSSSPASLPASNPTTGVVQVARMVEGIGKAEMHIDMRTQDFGSIEVHTVLRESQLGLSVGSERGDLRAFLAPEVPSLQAVIHQQDLRLDTLRFLESSAPSSAAFSGDADRQSNAQNRGQSSSTTPARVNESREVLEEISTETKLGLSVHA